VADLHPDGLRPFAIGNCQAGYQTLMAPSDAHRRANDFH
jgi:hypothetical protein